MVSFSNRRQSNWKKRKREKSKTSISSTKDEIKPNLKHVPRDAPSYSVDLLTPVHKTTLVHDTMSNSCSHKFDINQDNLMNQLTTTKPAIKKLLHDEISSILQNEKLAKSEMYAERSTMNQMLQLQMGEIQNMGQRIIKHFIDHIQNKYQKRWEDHEPLKVESVPPIAIQSTLDDLQKALEEQQAMEVPKSESSKSQDECPQEILGNSEKVDISIKEPLKDSETMELSEGPSKEVHESS